MRHLISGIDCAIAGAAMVAAPATPIPVTLIKSRRFMEIPPPDNLTCAGQPSFRGLPSAWNIRSRISMPNFPKQSEKPGLLAETGLWITT
jgi:hypothetical protein